MSPQVFSFWLFITLQDLTKEDDGILWVWFVLELTFAAILAYAIRLQGRRRSDKIANVALISDEKKMS